MCDEKGRIVHQIVPVREFAWGKTFKISIQVPMDIGWIERMKFSVVKGREKSAFQMKHVKNENGMAYFETTVFFETRAIYYYYFSFEINGIFKYHKRVNFTGDNSITNDECWKMSVNFNVPDWAKGKIMYHIFVDRYRKGRAEKLVYMSKRTIHQKWDESVVLGPNESGDWNVDFYGGDLKGIIDTIKYLKKLGVSIIYLSPIVWGQTNHRYDTVNYEEIDPYVGCKDDLKNLCDVAHRHGMRVILDAVFNHTGNDSIYFNEFGTHDTVGAYQSDNSPYFPFYKVKWKDGKRYHSFWWDYPNLPECNTYSWIWREYITGVNGIIDQWFALGIDGVRLDVADELCDEFIELVRIAVKRNKPDGFILVEVWENPMRMNRGYLESGKGMDTTMNYQLVDALIRYFKYADAFKLNYIIHDILREYPTESIFALMNFTSTHDISRPIEIFGCDHFNKREKWGWNLKDESIEWIKQHKLSTEEYKHGREVYQAYVFALAFLPGTLSIFYGDEVGATGIGNLANRSPYPWKRRDKKLLKYFRYIGKIRKNEKFMETAGLKIIELDGDKFVFERYKGTERILVAISRTGKEVSWQVPEEYEGAKEVYRLKNSTESILAPYSGIALKI